MADVESLSNDQLRAEFKEYGVSLGPVVESTRRVYEKKLLKLRKEGKSKKVELTPKTPKSKSPARPAASSKKANASRNTSRLEIESEESQEDSDQEAPVAQTPKSKPTTSSPTPNKREKSTERKSVSRPANTIIPGLKTNIPSMNISKQDAPSRSSITSSQSRSQRILETHSAYTPSSQRDSTSRYSQSVQSSFLGDRPGATPPRIGSGSRKITTSSSVTNYSSPGYTSASSRSFQSPSSFKSSRDMADLGNTTGEDDDEDDQTGEESTRYVFSSSTRGPSRTADQKLSPLRKLWNRTMTSQPKAEFKMGEPATMYDLRMGSTRTRFERDPRSGKMKLEQSKEKTWLEDLPRILIIIMSVFFAILAIAYVTTARKEAVANTTKVVSGAVRDSIRFFYTYLIVPSMVLGCGAALVVLIYFVHKKYVSAKEAEEAAIYDLVEKITDMIRDSASDGDEYLSIPHVRDVFFPPAKRRSAELARWERAVEYINENESRVATETRLLSGHECAVWRWLQPKKSGWQGKAFGQPVSLSPNVPKEALTKFLKVRDMFKPENVDRLKVEKDLREKVNPVRPLHIGFDESTNEGVVYVMLSDFTDAKDAFMALHGEWYNGRLVNVKYVRDTRYFERFPQANRLGEH